MDVDELWSASPVNESSNISEDLDELLALEEDCSNETDAFNNTDDANVEDLGITTCPIPIIDDPSTIMITTTRPVTTTATATDDDEDCLDDHLRDHGDNNNKDVERSGHVSPIPIPPDESSLGVVVSVSAPPTPILPLPVVLVAPTTPSSATAATPTVATSTRIEFHATMTTPSALSPTTLLNALLETSTPSLVTPILLEDSSEPVSNNNNNNGCSSRFTAHHPPPPLPITHTGVDAVDLEDLVFSVASANNNPVAKKTAIEATEVTEFLVDHTANGGVLPVEVDEKMQGSTSSDGIEQNVTYVTDLLQSSSSSHEAQLLVSNNPLHLEDPMNDTTTDQHVDEEFMDSKEDMPSQLLPDILSQWSKNDPIGRIEASVPSLFSEMDESGIFLSPNKSMMETSFIDSTSSPQIESLNEQTQTRNWPRSATGLSDTVSSDDEAILSFVTAKEAYDGDESTIASSKNSRETSGTAPISTDQRIATSVSFEMIFPPENNTTDSRCADLLDPSTPKRSGRFFMDNNDGDNWQTSGDVNSRLTGALTTPDIAETLPLSAPLVSSGIEELAPNGEHSVEMDSAGSRLLPQSSGAQQETAKDKDSVLDRAEILADPLEVTVDCIASVATDQIDHKPMATQVALENGEVDGTPTSIIESLAPIASMTICGEMSATIASPSIEVLKIEHIVNDSKHERQVNFELAETFERILENAEDAIVNDHLEPGIILELRDECNGSYSRAKSHLENCLPLNSLNNDTILFASNPNGDHFQRSQEGPVSVSSLLSKNAIGSNQILEDLYSKGKVKTLQVEFPAALESGLKRSDVSLSSASSTISHGSFTRGMTNSGATSSYNAERLQQRKNSTTDSLPPRFPENVKQHSEHSSSFADSLSYMLLAAKDDSDEADAVETKWMKHSVSASFNPLKSIFAGKSGISVDNDISPPGSPPEPYYSDYDEELESLQGNSCGSSSAVVLVKEAMIWGIMPEDDLLVFQNNSSQTGEEPSGKKSLDPVDGTVLKAPIESTNQDTLHVDPFVLKRNAIRRELSITKSESGRRSASLDFKMRSISPVMTDGLRNEPTRLSRSPSMDRSPTPNIRCFRSSPDLRKLDDQLVEHILTPSKSVRDVQDTVKLSPEALVERFAKLSEHGPTESLLNSALLEEELLAFSSLRRIDMPFDVAHQQDHDELKYLGSVRWRQLVAYWKHSEMSTAMMKRSDPPGSNNCLRKGTEDDGGGSRSSSCRQRISTTADLVLNGVSNDTAELPFLNTMKGFTSPQKEFTLSSISRFLSDIGCIHADSSSRACRHELSLPNQPILEDIVRSAEANVPTLSLLIQEIVTFSSSNSTELGSARSSIGVKKAEDIERKANYKYGGNIMLVKDVLRAQITFMEEGGLVCGLICLLRMTRLLETARDDTCHGPIELVRVKNLFFNKFQIGAVSASSLPTGYRHMLLNVRMIDGLIAEIQFNLLPLFCVLGQEGYQLHRELRDIEYMFDDNRTCSKVMASFDLRGLADDSLSPPSLNQVVDDVCFSDESAPAGETNGISLTFKNGFFPKEFDEKPAEMINEVTSDINQELEATKALIPEADLVHSAAPNRLTFEARYDLLKAVSDKNLTVEKLFRAVIEYGSTAASDKPRDVATFVCLYLFFSFILKESKGSGFLMRGHGVPTASDLVAYSHQCLLRCLKISNQAISMGMTGWLEYGSSSEVDRLHGCPFAVLRQLTYDFGSLDQWNEAECVCLALVARCEQFLPPFHPTTLVSLMDLAGVSSMLKKGSTSARLMSRVADRLSAYLAEAEMSLVAHLANSAMPVKKPGETVFQLQHTGGTFTKLHAFVTLFRHQLSKNMMMANGEVANVTALTCHCFVADSISVLANCATATKSILGFPSDVASVDGVSFWRLAFDHYQIAFDGFSRRNGLGDPSTLNSAYGVARCFREFGETEKALEFLSLVVSYTVDTTEVFGSDSERGKDKLPFRIEEDEKESPLRSFMPPFSIQNIMIDNHNAAMHTSSACCLWLMAILSLDQAPTEENRERSFKYLHAASISLQSALDRMCGIDDEVAKAFCIRFLGIIEDEAIRISEPTYE